MNETQDPPRLPHPREHQRFFGHQEAEAAFLQTLHAGRIHHGWMITGPRGVGKATLAFRMARFLLKYRGQTPPSPSQSLTMDEKDPIFKQVAALSHPDLLVIESAAEAALPIIKLEEAREMRGFFAKTAAFSGWRVCVIDAADDMNIHAANALLKTLEEPPPRAIVLLIAHRPHLLPATIRSRCRALALKPLPPETVRRIAAPALADADPAATDRACRFAEGSPGLAMDYLLMGGDDLYKIASAFLSSLPDPDPQRLHEIGARFTKKGGNPRLWSLFLEILTDALREPIANGEKRDDRRRWTMEARLRLYQRIADYRSQIERLNMNPAQAIFNLCLLFEKESRKPS